jgi:serine phosphatase RsbU (regulator of sigma subunit)
VPTPQDLATQLSQERYALSSLLEFARTLSPDLGPRGIMRSVLRTVMGKSLIKEAFAYLGISNGDRYEYELVARAGFGQLDLPQFIDRSAFEGLLAQGSELLTAIPLLKADGDGYLGLIGLGQSINPKLSRDSEAVYLASLAALTAIALTNAWLFEREKERERIESELRLARDIQQSLLPQKLPEMAGAEFAAVSKPSEWVGGDYYDVIQLDENRVLLAVADVVGKGVTAALTMSNLQAALRALAGLLREGYFDIVSVVKELNRLICESTSPERFITAAFGVLDVSEGRIEAVVCGHPNPIIALPDNSVTFIESTGIPLGIIPDFNYESRSYRIDSGSLLVFFTDGLSEAIHAGNLLGAEGTARLVLNLAQSDLPLHLALRRMISSAKITIEDDVTVLAVRLR